MFNHVMLENWRETMQEQMIADLKTAGLDCPANHDGCKVRLKKGRKYVKVIVGGGVRYFVEHATGSGTIFAAATRDKPNFNRSFGTVSEYPMFHWGGYEGVAKPGSGFTMKPTAGGYQTAIPV